MIKVHRSSNKEWYYTVHAKNGKVLVTSETMKRKSGIMNGIKSLNEIFIKPYKVEFVK